MPIKKVENLPPKNEVSSTTIGVTLVENYIKETYKGFNTTTYLEGSYLGATWGMKPTTLYYYKTDSKWDYYMCMDSCIIWQDKMLKSNRNVVQGGLKISRDKKTHKLFTMVMVDPRKELMESYGPKVKFSGNIILKDVTIIGGPAFKKEFIYGGKTGQTVKFTYREFVNDLARPSFTQEINYDLDESKIVGFKDLKIEIIKLTNSNIEYKVLSHFQ